MATHAPITGAPTRAPFIPVPPAAVTRLLSRFDRDQLAGFVMVAIDLLDVADGDTDLEDGGDDELTGDERDHSWPEWHQRGRRKLTAAGYEDRLHTTLFGASEDDEDDDPAEQDDEPEDEHDWEQVNEDGIGHHGMGLLPTLPRYGVDQSAGPLNQQEAEQDHRAAELGLVRSSTGGWRLPS